MVGFVRGFAMSAALGVVGCGPTVILDSGESGESDGDDDDDGGTTSSPDPITTTASASAGPSTATAGPVTATAGPMSTSAGPGSATVSTSGTTDPTGGGLPNGEQCMSNEECASGMCFLAGLLGGICSECLGDDDCAWGCTGPNPLAEPPEGAVCNDGLFGEGCETSEACTGGLLCSVIIDVPGVLTRSTCGECIGDADCFGGQLCAPDIDVASITGAWYCVSPYSVPLGGDCDLEGSGFEQCSTGYCGVADIMGLLQLGVCSECSNLFETDAGCLPGQTCVDPQVDLDGAVSPGYCT